MRRGSFRLVLATVLTLLGTSLALPTNPASAATPITISTPNTSTVGHVRGTITTTASHVVVQAMRSVRWPVSEQMVLTTTGGVATYNLPTWGWEPVPEFTLAVKACASADLDSCEADATQSAAFTPTSVAPTVTWPNDTTFGAGEDLALTVSDVNGGGVLVGNWNGDRYDIARSGRTVIELARDGTDLFTVMRCEKVGSSQCMDTGVARSVTRHALTIGSVTKFSSSYLKPDESSAADLVATVKFRDTDGTDFSVDWWLVDAYTRVRVPGVGRSVSGLELSGTGTVPVELDVTGAPDGWYEMTGTVSYTDAQVGRLSGPLDGAFGNFTIDRAAPTSAKSWSSEPKVYPVGDGYYDEVYGGVDDVGELVVMRLDVLDASGNVVRSDRYESSYSPYFRWRGRTEHGELVAPGTYRLRLTLTDRAGNSFVLPELTVTAYAGGWVKKTFDRSLSAKKTVIDTWKGKCSIFAKPKKRHWAGGIGLYSNTKCNSKKWERSGVVLLSGFRLPNARSYSENVTIRPYGGASKLEKRSVAYFQLWHPNKQKWLPSTQLKPKPRAQHSTRVPINRVANDDGWIVWRTLAAYGSKYDVKNFRVTFTYEVWE